MRAEEGNRNRVEDGDDGNRNRVDEGDDDGVDEGNRIIDKATMDILKMLCVCRVE